MRTILSTAAALLAALALALPVGAHECAPTTSSPELDTNPLAIEGVPRYYYDDDCSPVTYCPTDPLWVFWVYEESNGLDGLQRRDPVKDDTCGGHIASDTIIL